MMSLLPFWALDVVVVLLSMQGQKYLNLCSEDERRSYRFGTGSSGHYEHPSNNLELSNRPATQNSQVATENTLTTT